MPRHAPVLFAALVFLSWAGTWARAQTLTSTWSRSFPTTAARYVPLVDAAARTAIGGPVVFFDEADQVRLVHVGAPGAIVVNLPATALPVHHPTVPPHQRSIESADASHDLVFGPTAKRSGDGWLLPIPQASVHDLTGAVIATYSNVLDQGFLASDGSLLLSYAGRGAGLAPAADPLLLDSLVLHAGVGTAPVAVHVDPDGEFDRGVLAADASLFVYPRESETPELVALSPTGTVAWTYSIAGVTVGGRAGIAIAPDGSRVAFQPIPTGSQPGSTSPPGPVNVRVLDANGNLAVEVAPPGGAARFLRFTSDGSQLLVVGAHSALLASTGTGQVSWSRTLATPDWYYCDGQVGGTPKVVALASKLSSDAQGVTATTPAVQLRVEVVHVATGATLLDAPIPRDDGPSATGGPTAGPRLALADDGQQLLAALPHALHLFSAN